MSKKILTFSLVTNGTIDFKDELINKLKHSKKVRKITISNYKNSPNLKIPLKQEDIIKKLIKNKIPYSLDSNKENSTWFDPEKIYKRGRNKEEIIKKLLLLQNALCKFNDKRRRKSKR
ncbi:hypothetical protein OLX76_02395 [Campylobacter jejuni]|nr:hypothetical protein [Campylobacter jejuni]